MWAERALTQEGRTSGLSSESREWLRGLDAFGIPYMVSVAGEPLELSMAATTLLDRPAWRTAVCAQATQLAEQALRNGHGSPSIGLPRAIGDVPACGLDHLQLGVFVLPGRHQDARVVLVLRPRVKANQPCPANVLTDREREVAQLIGRGFATKQVAASLGISTHTARHHTERVFDKLSVRTRAAVAAIMAHHISG
jgi:DNA-binding CsgD family transcriptional regulator